MTMMMMMVVVMVIGMVGDDVGRQATYMFNLNIVELYSSC